MTHTPDHIAQLLDQAPKVPTSPELGHQILSAVLLDKAADVPASPTLHQTILSTASTTQQPIARRPASRPARRWFYPNALAGGLMAASLILGIWSGSNDIVDNLLAAPFELAGLQVTETEDEFSLYNTTGEFTPSENLL